MAITRLREFTLAAANFLLAALLLAGLAAPAHAAFPPRPAGPIYDGAEMISPATEAALDQRLRDYNAQTGRAIVVATIPSLEGQALEPYATDLFTEWGIGGAKRDQGLLLLIARDDRKLRIEVGYGLHPYFGGIMAGRVIRDVITPRFKAGDIDGGIVAGIDAITAHLARSPEDAAAIAEAAEAAEKANAENVGPILAGIAFMIVMVAFFVLMFAWRHRGRAYRGKGGKGGGVASTVGQIILWEALNAATRAATKSSGGGWSGGGGGGFGGFGGGGGGFGGFGGGMSGGGGASGGW